MTITHTYDPAQYVLVPRDLSPGMFRRMLGRELLNMDRPAFASLKQTYSEFIAAAPPPPAPQADDARMREFNAALTAFAIQASTDDDQVAYSRTREHVMKLYAAALQSQADAMDAARLDFMVSHGYFFGHTRDGESCWLMRHADGDGELRVEKLYESHPNARAAIDAAIAARGAK